MNSVALDTCQALTEYLQSPANTTLDNLLPCEDLANASTAFTSAREGIRNIIIEVYTYELWNLLVFTYVIIFFASLLHEARSWTEARGGHSL